MTAQKILLLAGDFTEDYQAQLPLQMLSMIGHQVDCVCPDKKAGERIRTVIHEQAGEQAYSEQSGHWFVLNKSFHALDVMDYDALIIPGGRAPQYLRLDVRIIDLVRHFALNNKPIASICHGAQILAAAGVLEGKHCSAHPSLKPDLLRYGVKWMQGEESSAQVCLDGKLLTAASSVALISWMRQFCQLLGSRIAA